MREEWRHVTMVAKFRDLNNLSWQKWPFVLSNDKRKVWPTVLFLTVIMHRKVIHDGFFVFSFFRHIWRTAKFCYHGNLTWRLLLFVPGGREPLGWLECLYLSFLKREKGLGIGNVLKEQHQNKLGGVTSGELSGGAVQIVAQSHFGSMLVSRVTAWAV